MSGKSQAIREVLITYFFLSMALLGTLVSTNDMLGDCFDGLGLSPAALLGIALWELLVAVGANLQKHFLPFRGQVLLIPALATGLLTGVWWKLVGGEKLTGGGRFLLSILFRAVNEYYDRDLPLPGGTPESALHALAFVMMLLLTLLVSCGAYFRRYQLLLAMPLAVLILEMLVGMTPGLRGMGCFFLLLVLLNCSLAERLQLRYRLLSLAVTCLILLLAGKIADSRGAEILGKVDCFSRFQLEAEKFIKEVPVGQGLLWAPHLDNQKPEFEDKLVLTVTCRREVEGKLYLRESFADHYWRGYWTVNQKPLKEAAKTAEVDLDLLWEELADRLYQRALQSNLQTAQYTVTCAQFGSGKMYLPYGAHWEPKGEFSLNNQGGAVKNRLFAARSFQAPLTNDFSNTFRSVTYDSYDGKVVSEEGAEALSWYDSYLRGHVEPMTDQPTARQIAEALYSTLPTVDGNSRRLACSQAVASYLTRNYTYSLELEELPDGADAIEFFLSEGGKGYCMHFASAGVAILRYLGVPSRYAFGYVIPSSGFARSEDVFTARVLDSQAHAWVEIYLDGIGWVPVEMTPGYSDGELSESSEDRREPEEEQVPGEEPSSETSPESTQASEEESADLPSEESSEDGSRRENGEEQELPAWEITIQDSGGQTGSAGGTEAGGDRESGEATGDRPVSAQADRSFAEQAGLFLRKAGAALLALLKPVLFLAGAVLLVLGGRQLVRRIRRRRFLRREKKIKRFLRSGKHNAAAVMAHRFLYQELCSHRPLSRRPETDERFLEQLKERFPNSSSADWDRYYGIILRAFYGKDEITAKEAEFVCAQALDSGRGYY